MIVLWLRKLIRSENNVEMVRCDLQLRKLRFGNIFIILRWNIEAISCFGFFKHPTNIQQWHHSLQGDKWDKKWDLNQWEKPGIILHASVFAWHSECKSIVWSSNPCLLPLPSTKFWYLVSYLLVRISPSIRSSEIDASGVLCVCVSAVRCLERTNRAGRLLLSVYREKSVGMRETEVKCCCLSWTETTKVLSTH